MTSKQENQRSLSDIWYWILCHAGNQRTRWCESVALVECYYSLQCHPI